MIEIKVLISSDMSEVAIDTKATGVLIKDICIAIQDSILETIDDYNGEE